MQLITRCPHCKTAFAFDAAQIRIAQGWVRCGKCAELFESDKHLFKRKAVSSQRVHEDSQSSEVGEGVNAELKANLNLGAKADSNSSTSEERVNEINTLSKEDADAQAISTQRVSPNVEPPDFGVINAVPPFDRFSDQSLVDLGISKGEWDELEKWKETEEAEEKEGEGEVEVDVEGEVSQVEIKNDPLAPEIHKLRSDLEYLHDSLDETNWSAHQQINKTLKLPADKRGEDTIKSLSEQLEDFGAFKSEPADNVSSTAGLAQSTASDKSSSAVWGFIHPFALSLLVLLSVCQVLWYYKEILGAFSAESHFLMKSICSSLGVELSWPQETDGLRIESSSFKLIQDESYRLKLRIKNRQDYAVKTPLLELTLLSAEERVLVRKIFKPKELDLQEAISSDKDLNLSLDLHVEPTIATQIVGYKIDFFYP